MNNTLEKILLTARRNPSRLAKIVLRRLGFEIDTGKRYSTELELLTLQKYAAKARSGIVEIGVLDGGTTREMALVARVPIYGIDPLIPDSMDEDLIGHEEIIRKNLKFYKEFYFFGDYSYNVVKKWNKPFDFIWIDGDHHYEACRKDFDDWFPLLQQGGFIAFHDSAPVTSVAAAHQGYAGPIKLVTELENDWRLRKVETADSITIFQKL